MTQEVTAARTVFAAAGNSVEGFLAHPTVQVSAPGLVLIQEWWGLNPHIENVAERLARAGYFVAAVDLYDGQVTKDPHEAAQLMNSLDPHAALEKLGTAIAWLRQQHNVGAVGVMGFCMGGVYTLLTASKFQVDAAAAFYGIPDDLGVLQGLSCPVLFIGGEKDQWITVEKMHKLDAALKQYGKEGEVKIYAGADHAFFNDTRPEVYRAKDAADAWQTVLDFFGTHLNKGQASGV
jgi:carboxymethylenebutenolidase